MKQTTPDEVNSLGKLNQQRSAKQSKKAHAVADLNVAPETSSRLVLQSVWPRICSAGRWYFIKPENRVGCY